MPGRHKIPTVSLVNISTEEEMNNNERINDMPTPPSSPISSSASSAHTDSSEDVKEAGDCLFSPSLSSQRHRKVLDILEAEQVSSLLDTGCNNCKFLQQVRQLPSLTYLAGVDIDKDVLEISKQRVSPLAADYLACRDLVALVVELWVGDVTDLAGAAVMESRVEAVTSIEIIEHLQRWVRFGLQEYLRVDISLIM